MNTDSTTLYKLMILYMLSKVNFPLSNVQISTFMLDKEYTNYFTFQETINSLVEDSFIQQINYENNTQYKLTQEGEDTVAFFYTKISQTRTTATTLYPTRKPRRLSNRFSLCLLAACVCAKSKKLKCWRMKIWQV